METWLKTADQIYKFLFAKHRKLSEALTILLLGVLIHITISFFAGRYADNDARAADEPHIRTGDHSPVVDHPQGPVTINDGMRK